MVIAVAGIFGLLIGGVLVDLDHKCSIKDKWLGFWSAFKDNDQRIEECERGILHKPVVMLSMASFFIMLGVGLLLHYIADINTY